MATKLKNMRLTSVDLVRAGANQEADICLFKSDTSQEATERPTEREKNIFKRFIAWLRETDVEPQNDPQEDLEKADDQKDPAEIYKSAITESIKSIIADESLTVEEKTTMVEKSLGQYHDAMTDLAKSASVSEEEDMGYLFDGLEKSAPDFDEIDEIEEL